MAANDFLEKQIIQLQKQVAELVGQFEGFKEGCSARHRLNLTAEISQVKTDLGTLKKLIDSNGQSISGTQTDYAELTGRYNILRLKQDSIENELKQSKDNRSNFITQLMVAIIAALVTGLLSVFGTFMYMGLKTSFNDNSPYTHQAMQIPIQNDK